MTDALAAVELLVPGRRAVVAVTGPDARSFLQSLLSQDLAPVRPGAGVRSLLLEPQGKLRAAVRVLCIDDETFWCDTDSGWAEAFADGLRRFRIRVKVEIEVRPDLAVVEIRGTDCDAVVAAVGYEVPPAQPHAHCETDGVRCVRAPWRGLGGIDVVTTTDDVTALEARLVSAGVVIADADRTTTLRVLHGVVQQGLDIDESTIAQEAHLEADSVSFTKGCFVGQELVCRIDSRGHVNRFVRRLVFADPAIRVDAGTEVRVGDRVVGTITTGAPDAPIALAVVRREVEPGAEVLVDGATATVESLV